MATSGYTEILAWLYALEAAKGMDFKLERVMLALNSLGNPHSQFASVHIAGTNGKGSTAAMLHAICTAAGYQVGLYTSPHLVSFTERIQIGATSITEEEVVDLAREIRTAATVRGIDLTFFEFVTVMAFLHFARQRVDLAVVEVGLGGRLDATNVLEPEVAVITTIGLDHQEFLGDNLESVASEKAGVIKPQRPVIIGNVPNEVRPVFTRVVAERGATVHWLGQDFCIAEGGPLRFSGFGCEIGQVKIPLRGVFQQENAATAIGAALCLRRTFTIGDDAVRRGLASVHWPGRLEVVRHDPLLILDGAHNADGMAALVREIPHIAERRPVHLLFGVMRDKHWQPMIDTIGPHVSTATVTTVLPPRGETPAKLAEAFRSYCPVSIALDACRGLQELLHLVPPNHVVLVTGSLFLIGAIYSDLLTQGGQPSCLRAGIQTLQP